MNWIVEFADEFTSEFYTLQEEVQTSVLTMARLLQHFGPHLGRPRVDTLNGSRHANMKEMRFGAADGEWRLAFAFDPKRRAILLVAGTGREAAPSASIVRLSARPTRVSTGTSSGSPGKEDRDDRNPQDHDGGPRPGAAP